MEHIQTQVIFAVITFSLGIILSLVITIRYVAKGVFIFEDIDKIKKHLYALEKGYVRQKTKKNTKQDLSNFKVEIGRTEEGEVVGIDLTTSPHTFISGATGGGKTNLLLQILVSALRKKSLVDFVFLGVPKSQGDFSLFEDIGKCAYYEEDWLILLEELEKELKGRAEKIAKAKKENFNIKDIVTFNKHSKEKMKQMIVILDEVQEIVRLPKGKEVVTKLASQGRTAGINIFAATQNMDKKKLGGDALSNATTKISLRVKDASFSMYFLGEKGAEKLQIGECLVLQNGELKKCLIPEITQSKIKRFVNQY